MGMNGPFPTPPTELADNVVALHIKYFNGGDWLESWDSTAIPAPAQLPVAVSIDLLLGTGTRSQHGVFDRSSFTDGDDRMAEYLSGISLSRLARLVDRRRRRTREWRCWRP